MFLILEWIQGEEILCQLNEKGQGKNGVESYKGFVWLIKISVLTFILLSFVGRQNFNSPSIYQFYHCMASFYENWKPDVHYRWLLMRVELVSIFPDCVFIINVMTSLFKEQYIFLFRLLREVIDDQQSNLSFMLEGLIGSFRALVNFSSNSFVM